MFSQQEVEQQFSHLSSGSIKKTLYRLIAKKKIQSIWHNVFVVVPVEYGLKGIVPPIEYIDHLMKYLEKDYYVALLSAASLQGASHQQPMEFYVANSGILRNKTKGDIKINFVTKKNIPIPYLTKLMTNSGYVNVSIPELTAFDLVMYAKNVGGINRVATILSELAEEMNFRKMDVVFFKLFPSAAIQRLGYLLDLLEFNNLADALQRKIKQANIKFKKYPLSVVSKGKKLSDYDVNEKWKIIINTEIEIDDL